MSKAIAGLRACDIDCVTAAELGLDDADDEHLLRHAAALGRVILSLDDDF